MDLKKTILVVDDHPFFREGLKSYIGKYPNYEVIGEAGSGAEGLEKAGELKPDLVIMDISLPDVSGIEATRTLRESIPETRIVVLSMHLKVDYITKAFRAGATGYVAKESTSERIIECLDTVSRGDYYLDASLHHEVVRRLVSADENEPEVADAAYNTLTPREQEILLLVAEGLSTHEIADKLFISKKTAENHKSRIMSKLDLHSTRELMRYAAKHGLINGNPEKE